MREQVQTANVATLRAGLRLSIPSLAPLHATVQQIGYAALRFTLGPTNVAHGIPKVLDIANGSMCGSINFVNKALNLPCAPHFAMLAALLATFGGLAVALGLAARFVAPTLAVQMAFIGVARWPTHVWIEQSLGYALVLGSVALLLSIHGGGASSIDRRVGRDL